MKRFRLTNQEIKNNKCHLNEEIGNPQMKKSKNTNEEFDNSTNEEIKKCQWRICSLQKMDGVRIGKWAKWRAGCFLDYWFVGLAKSKNPRYNDRKSKNPTTGNQQSKNSRKI